MHTTLPKLTAAALALTFTSAAFADGAFYGDPPNETHPWTIHDMNRPQPPIVTPGTFSTPEQPGKPPSDAIVLFDGTAESIAKNWEADKNGSEPAKWIAKDGAFQCVPGSGVRTKAQWADCQLHVEWAAPAKVDGNSQGRGNSGIFPMGQALEIQVLDNYNNPTYADGFAGSVYGVNPPMANVVRPPGEWQVYDIIFRRPVHKDGKLVDSGRVTVMLNGVVTQDATPLEGGGGHMARSKDHPYPEKGPLKLQDHGNTVRYRNIWYRPLVPRSVEGGDGGVLTPEAATAKKKEIAAKIRNDAAKKQGRDKLLHLMESLCYDQDAATLKEVEGMTTAWLDDVKKTSPDKMESKKGEVMQMNGAVNYLTKFKFLPEGYAAKGELGKIIKDNAWDKPKK